MRASPPTSSAAAAMKIRKVEVVIANPSEETGP
jgi:hypothetical protein